MGKKQQVIEEIFRICLKNNDFTFTNEIVKVVCKKYNFKNPFDVTKLDNTSVFPQILIDNDYFILHLGKGKHRFVKGIHNGYHDFEEIEEENIINWKYMKSILNELDTSESNILSIVSNQRIIHDFLYDDIVANPKVYNARRTKTDLFYKAGEYQINALKQQMEIDLTFEYMGKVTIFEGKNGFPKDFAIYQLFHPFKYYFKIQKESKLDINQITCCYVLRKQQKRDSIIKLYNYTFKDTNDISSIKLLKKAQYNLIKR